MDIFNKFKHNIPHILFYGNVKEDIVKQIENLYPDNSYKYIMKLYCGTSKGIKNIRDDIKLFSKQQLSPNILFKSIILYDAEYLTVDAQYSLRRSIEIYSHSTRFFILTNQKDKLLQPIRSRFIQIYINSNVKVKPYIPQVIIKRIITKDASIDTIVEELYSNGIYGDQIVFWLKNKIKNYDELIFNFNYMRTQLKNERLCLFYLVCIFRNNKEI
jgi:hypothetical protein|tara:strand:- start:672 stop:1316 length:645 start_codon:yes stop_codon:yes gene_type:complete